MQNKLSIVALVAIVAATAGFVGYISHTPEEITPATTFVTSPLISGHLTIEARDADGNLKAIRTSDNVITRAGEDCVARALFTGATRFGAAASTGSYCSGAVTEPFTTIGLGSGTTQEQGTDFALQTPITGSGLDPAVGAITTWTNSTGAAGGGGATLTISKTFTASGGATVSEAGLFNGTATSTNALFAHKVFAPITLASSDQLTVAWTITMGNTTTFN